MICLFVSGFRMKAISIIGREVMRPRGLVGLATDTLDHCQEEIREVRIPYPQSRVMISNENRLSNAS